MSNREEWELEQERRKMLQDEIVTEYKKNKFIKEIKNGLGKSIMEQPNNIQKKPTTLDKIKKLLGWN
jgi:hypothetical protein